MSDKFKEFIAKASEVKDKDIENTYMPHRLEYIKKDLDATINFRVNSGLKFEFEHLCKSNQSTMAREIKRFMLEAVRSQRLI